MFHSYLRDRRRQITTKNDERNSLFSLPYSSEVIIFRYLTMTMSSVPGLINISSKEHNSIMMDTFLSLITEVQVMEVVTQQGKKHRLNKNLFLLYSSLLRDIMSTVPSNDVCVLFLPEVRKSNCTLLYCIVE